MSKTTTNQNETQTETEDMLQEDQEFQETENINEAEKNKKDPKIFCDELSLKFKDLTKINS